MCVGVQLTDFFDGEHKTSRAIKGAPLESLFSQFCLHSLWFGNCNIRGMFLIDWGFICFFSFVKEVVATLMIGGMGILSVLYFLFLPLNFGLCCQLLLCYG